MIDLLQWDRTVFDWINSDWSSAILDEMMPWISHLGDAAAVWLWIALLGLLMFRQLARMVKAEPWPGEGSTRIKAIALPCLYLALIYCVNAGAYNSLKHLFYRPRPFVEQAVALRVSLETASHLRNDSSFPSGHAANAFMVSALFAQRLRRMRFGLYGVAAMVALSRVYLGVHYPSDVLVGSFLGLTITWFMLSFIPLRDKWTHNTFMTVRD
ncbi:undecaprenyl-diphosphatase [Syntrophus gentianae]|uniref:Undecaprenyl-diphosphatase n=1 Tax=Syntrophus gentianae TaxID=43775 RepID=A0A1H7Y5X3_9BACT|nr:phosphatase PAP2 family protein [Syntrophus gentianae]SEM41626.1 undecaprenyl-diphosphatase [Syntrophus gentianae]